MLQRTACPSLSSLLVPGVARDPSEPQKACGHIRKYVAVVNLNSRLQATDHEDSRGVVRESTGHPGHREKGERTKDGKEACSTLRTVLR